MPTVKVANFFGGIDIKTNVKELKDKKPAIVVGTPGRIKQVGAGAPARAPMRDAISWGRAVAAAADALPTPPPPLSLPACSWPSRTP
jgi:hypothetical protein